MKEATIILEDRTQWSGYSFGAENSCSGELVFNTGMVGYPESLTDPSYLGQILMLTYPLIGNYGVPAQEKTTDLQHHFESSKIQASALVIQHLSTHWSHWNSARSLAQWLKTEGIPGICGIDTRGLTQHLRSSGTMLAKIIIDGDVDWYAPDQHNLVAQSSCTQPRSYGNGSRTVILIDCGVKHQIIHQLVQHDLTVIVVPWDYSFSHMSFDGIFVSNGPGDPRHCTKTVHHLRAQLQKNIPIFGICMGHQLLGMAAGASIYKLKYGHRSQNQPVIEEGTHRCLITAQNHGYAIDAKTLPKDWKCWFTNLNDQSCAGLSHTSGYYKSVQFHPEATPGPHDAQWFFIDFRRTIEECS